VAVAVCVVEDGMAERCVLLVPFLCII